MLKKLLKLFDYDKIGDLDQYIENGDNRQEYYHT